MQFDRGDLLSSPFKAWVKNRKKKLHDQWFYCKYRISINSAFTVSAIWSYLILLPHFLNHVGEKKWIFPYDSATSEDISPTPPASQCKQICARMKRLFNIHEKQTFYIQRVGGGERERWKLNWMKVLLAEHKNPDRWIGITGLMGEKRVFLSKFLFMQFNKVIKLRLYIY